MGEDFDCRPVGVVNLQGLNDTWMPQIGYYIETSVWGKGVATEAVRLALEYLRGKGYHRCFTTVLENNLASRRVLEKNGFTLLGPARPKELTYWVKL